MTELPPGARLFHVGPPKTGTTALQAAAAARRTQLLAHGVRYPGTSRNHRLAVAAFLGRGTGWGGGRRAPSMRHWFELVGELAAEGERRTWFGHEYAAHADPGQIGRFANALGPSLEVVITLRGFAGMLPSIWQEHLKLNGGRRAFEPWLRSVLCPGEAGGRRDRYDHVAMLERWIAGAGRGKVSVVVLDPADQGFAFRAFEGLLGLPAGLLDGTPGGSNRSLSAPEAELLRRLNQLTRREGLPWPDHERLVVRGGVDRLLASPAPGQRVELPEWAVPLANREGERIAEAVAASGVRVIGDPALLAAPAAPAPGAAVTHVPIDVAVAAMAGILSAATGQGPDFRRSPDRAGRQLLVHLRHDLRAGREIGFGRLAGHGIHRAGDSLRGLGYAALGWRNARR
ncbi:hypothetical protein [Propionicimonas sp.]|uniref:hypothetical protein n=1 Tax=Propionicimonas sp. TaxID=1955623 RepID=UPI0039E3D325